MDLIYFIYFQIIILLLVSGMVWFCIHRTKTGKIMSRMMSGFDIGSIVDVFGKLSETIKKGKTTDFYPMRNCRTAIITYTDRSGTCHKLVVPYYKSQIVEMSKYRVYLQSGDEKTDITQQSGIPYFFSACDYGADAIIISDIDDGTEYSIGPKEIPFKKTFSTFWDKLSS